MNQDDYFELSMTQMELMLKHYISLRPDIKKKILMPEELSDYLAWMAAEHSHHSKNRYTLGNIPVQIEDPFHRDLAERVMRDPSDMQAFSLLTATYESQHEDQNILANHDISLGRMLRYMPDQWHAADHFMIYYARSGETTVHFKDSSIRLRRGSVLIIAPNVVHANVCYEDDCVVWYYLARASTFDRVFWNQLSQNSLMSRFFRQALSTDVGTAYLYFDTFDDEEITWLAARTIKEFKESNTYRAQMLNTLMSAFFVLLLRKHEGTAKLPRTDDFFWKHEFSAIFSYIQTHYHEATIMEVADKFHYSKRQISRIVQQCTGLTYSQLILKLKMEQAALLLSQHTASIPAIAFAVGYADVSSFYRAFTKYYQMTPIEFQSQHQ